MVPDDPTFEPGDAALAGSVVGRPGSIERRSEGSEAFWTLLQLPFVESHAIPKSCENANMMVGDGGMPVLHMVVRFVSPPWSNCVDRERQPWMH